MDSSRPACVREVERWTGVMGNAFCRFHYIVLAISQYRNVSFQETPFVNVDFESGGEDEEQIPRVCPFL
jgi:hypothetical protein